MRKRVKTIKLSMNKDRRRIFLRDMSCELIQHERVRTTVPRAKAIKRQVERTITLAKNGVASGVEKDIESAKRKVYDRLQRKLAVEKMFDVLVDRYKDRRGGYTRIIRLDRRAGDNAEMVYIELVEKETKKIRSEADKGIAKQKDIKKDKQKKDEKQKDNEK